MIINHNMAALNTFNNLTTTGNSITKSLEKLSSGYRINRASDDAAGLAISEKMRGQINGLSQASDNAQDGVSLLQTAEGGLTQTTTILQRMNELAVQAASDATTDDDRTSIQAEMTQLVTQIDRIATQTQYNTINLLDGSLGSTVATATKNQLTNTSLSIDSAAATISAAFSSIFTVKDSDGNSLGITTGDIITVSYIKDGTYYSNSVVAVNSASSTTLTASVTLTKGTYLSNGTAITADVTFSAGTSITALGTMTTVSAALTIGATADMTMAFVSATSTSDASLQLIAATAGTDSAIQGYTVTVTNQAGDLVTDAGDAFSSFSQTTVAQDKQIDGTVSILVGANTGQNQLFSINSMRSTDLGLGDGLNTTLDVSTTEAADSAVKVIQTATSLVSAERGKIGALQNRLDYTVSNLTTEGENLTSAESRIRDVDMSEEMMNYTKLSIINQAGTTMLAQAKSLPQTVLTLLQS